MTLNKDGLVERLLAVVADEADEYEADAADAFQRGERPDLWEREITIPVAWASEAATFIQTLQRDKDALREALRPFAERAVGYEHLPAFETDARFQHLRRARLLLKEGGE